MHQSKKSIYSVISIKLIHTNNNILTSFILSLFFKVKYLFLYFK
jgi:hypothetical protein